MKRYILSLLSVFFVFSCNTSPESDILIEGVLIETVNVRFSTNTDSKSNIIYTGKPGDIVEIVSFEEDFDRDGFAWCEVNLDRPEVRRGEEYRTGWMVYKQKDLPWIVSLRYLNNIERMYEMEYEQYPNEILSKKSWLTQAIYDYTYDDYLEDVKESYDELIASEKDYKEVEESSMSPRYSVDYDEDQSCRVRISTASKERKEDALYAVVFNQTPRTIHFFRQDPRTSRGTLATYKEMGFLNSSIKTLQRKKRKSSVYYSDGYGYKERLSLEYDAIRIRPREGRARYIVYNDAGYTSPNLNNLYLKYVTEY